MKRIAEAFAVGFHRLLLPFYGTRFRATHGEEMLVTVRTLSRRASVNPFRFARFLWVLFVDALSSFEERIAGAGRSEHGVTRPGNGMGPLFSDLRSILRELRRAPTYSFVVILTLAIAIGANASVFSIVDNVLLRALPFPNPGTLSAWTD